LKTNALSAELLVTGVLTNAPGLLLKSILLVDDSRFMRTANERALARAGYSVVTASDGEEALQIALTRIPDLILLDMLLPKLGGLEVLHALRKNPVTASIPVVVLSSLPQKNEDKLIEDGAAAYLEKSRMALDQHAESLLHIVKRTLDGVAAVES
jgi:CheY-like chemotaxis protein